tara:strand:+ start:4644 stop:4943 length:300 start_codon:yes stop_codon:yes gene_type:complete
MNEHQSIAFHALCCEYDTVISRRCVILRDALSKCKEGEHHEAYRITYHHRASIQPRDSITDAALAAFSQDFHLLKKLLENHGYYTAVWDLQNKMQDCLS